MRVGEPGGGQPLGGNAQEEGGRAGASRVRPGEPEVVHGELNSMARCWLREARCGNHSWKQFTQVMGEPGGTSAPLSGALQAGVGGNRAALGLAPSRMEPGQHRHCGHSPQPCEPVTRAARKEPAG